MKLIVGLGNPGDKYAGTRHNVGFVALNVIAEAFGFEDFKKADKYKSFISEGQIAGEKCLLVKPQTFMNLSGEAVLPLMSFYKIKSEDIVVVYDEFDLPFGQMRIRTDGSAGGHNGIKSIIKHVGTSFIRLRLGIGPAEPFPGALEDYVLGRLTAEQKDQIIKVFNQLPAVLEAIIQEGPVMAQGKYN